MSGTVKLTHTPFSAHTGDPVMLTDAHVQEPVIVINTFSVPAGREDLFLARWKVGVGVMAAQPGFIQGQMFRAMDESAELSFVNIVKWASGEALAQARKNPEWRASVQRMMDEVGVRPHPGLYQAELAVNAGDKP
jgi:heme-degrading monooxygenase HmoA